VVAQYTRTFVQNGLEESAVASQLRLACLSDLVQDLSPHIRHNDHVSQRALAAQLSEHLEIARRDAAYAHVRDAVHVDDTGQLLPALVPGICLSA
jgi:ribosomal protein S15P/S13E